jgi:hypothetical protein
LALVEKRDGKGREGMEKGKERKGDRCQQMGVFTNV